MPDDLSPGAAFAFLTVVGVIRGVATWAAGVGARRAGESSQRADQMLSRPSVRSAQRVVERWGGLAVAGSYVVVGTQTAVTAAAGLMRMSARRAVPAIVVGSALRAAIYVTVGIALIRTWLTGESEIWVALAAAMLVGVGVATYAVRRRYAAT